MNSKQLRRFLEATGRPQRWVAWISGCSERHARNYALGVYPIPLHTALLIRAVEEGKLSERWLEQQIGLPAPRIVP